MSKEQQPPHGGGEHHGLEISGSRGQQILIIVLVVAIAAIFGMQGSLELLGKRGNPYGDALAYKKTCEQLQGVINPRRFPIPNMVFVPQFRVSDDEKILDVYQNYLKLADVAAEEGLMPEGEVLDKLYADFLATENMLEGGKTFRELIHPEFDREQGKPPLVSRREIERYLAVTRAVDALETRYRSDVGARPRLAGRYAYHMAQDRALVDRVDVSTASLVDAEPRFLEEAGQDQGAIEAFYAEHRDDLFAVLPKLTVSLVYASGVELGKKIKIPEADIAAYYEEHKEEYAEVAPPAEPPKEGEKPPEPEKTYKPLDAVRDEIRTILEKERGTVLARKLMRRTEDALIEANLVGRKAPQPADLAAIAAAAKAVAITPDEDASLIEPVHLVLVRDLPAKVERTVTGQGAEQKISWTYDLGETFGTIHASKVAALHEKEAGWISSAITPRDEAHKHLRMLVHVDATEPATHRPLEEVQGDIVRYLAARRAWPELVDRLTAVRETLPEGGSLAEHFAQEAVKAAWPGAKVETAVKQPLMVTVGEPDRDLEVTDLTKQRTLFSLARAGGPGPVVLVPGTPPEGTGDDRKELLPFPALALIQVTGVERADEADERGLQQGLWSQDRAFTAFLSTEFNTMIQQRLLDLE